MPSQHSVKNLFFYTDSTYFSGAEQSFALLAKSCATKSHTLTFFVTPEISAQFQRVLSPTKVKPSASRSKLSLKLLLFFYKTLKKNKPDAVVVNMWSPYANTLLLIAARLNKIPTIGIYHYFQDKKQVDGPLRVIKLGAYNIGERLLDRVLTVSKAHQKVLIEEFNFPQKKVAVIPNGAPKPTSKPDFKDHQPRKLLTVGSLERAKGYDFLLGTLATVTTPWELTILGDGPERQNLEKLAKNLPYPVIFAGKQSDTASYYQNHDVLLQPSHFENLSMAIIESMSFGLTCIANDVGGNSELIKPGESGWLLTLNDQKEWNAAIKEACTRPLTNLREAAETQWSEHFTLEAQYEAFNAQLTIALNE